MVEETNQAIWDALRQVIDPEIGLDVVELGLVYAVERGAGEIRIDMTLTSAGCPMGDQIIEDAKRVVAQVAEGDTVQVELVWEPFWTPERMSDRAKELLGW